jgi:outer membrane protein OmpA-like peptidoglycan-associated protein
LPEYDRYAGFHFQNKGHVQIDNLQLLQDRGKINLVQDAFTNAKKENLGTKVNTIHYEKSPLITHDGKTLYFVRSGDPNNTGNPENDDIWYTTLDNLGQWTEAQNIGKPLNNSGHNTIIALTSDHNTAFVKHHYDQSGEYEGQGFSITQRNAKGWNVPQKIIVPNYYNNSKYTEATVSPDGKVLLFTAQRDDTHGGKDIYVSKQNPDGSWSEPINAGTEINSFGNETGPFIAGDGKTLYFASNGHPGFGDMDIFMSRRLDDSWTKWSTPLNLGNTINTEGWDAYFTVDAKGEWAYMTSNENSIGNLDIFRIKLPKQAKPEPVAIIHGYVYNAKTNKPLMSEISFHVLENDSTLGKIYTNPSDGSFTIILKEGFHYNILANYPGYIAERYNLDLSQLNEYTEKQITLYLKPIEVNQSITLNNIFFAPDQAVLLYESRCELHHVARIMKEHPTMHIMIGGHTEIAQGYEKYHQKLSEDRAKAVYHFLHHHLGVDKHRMSYKGFGYSKPIYNTTDKALNAQNRRVDFTIVKY